MASWQQTLETYQQRTFTGELPRYFMPGTNHPETGCRVFCYGSAFLVRDLDLGRVRCESTSEVERRLSTWGIPPHDGWL